MIHLQYDCPMGTCILLSCMKDEVFTKDEVFEQKYEVFFGSDWKNLVPKHVELNLVQY
jgi:hypothetical protein